MIFSVKVKVPHEVSYFLANCAVRYWEDASVNGDDDKNGNLIPCRQGDNWCPLIDLKTGKIQDWPFGTTAEIHYTVCGDGVYFLLDDTKKTIVKKDGYVPSMLSPNGYGFRDYIVMNINESGYIENWKVDLSYFEKERSEL
jgi:hypothetical protein